MNRCPRSSSPHDETGPQQRLRLPHLAPARVVGAVGLQRPHQRAAAPLRPQVGVDDQRRVRARRAQHLPDRLRDRRRELHGVGVRDAFIRFTHEEHVGVGAVAEFGAAELAHADDGDPRRGPAQLGLALPERGGQRALQHCDPDAGQRRAHGPDVEQAQQVRARHAQQFVPPQRTRRRDRGVQPGLAPDGRPQRRRHVGRMCGPAAAPGRRAAAAPRARGPAGRAPASTCRAGWPAVRRPCLRRAAPAGTTACPPTPRKPCGRTAARRPGRGCRRAGRAEQAAAPAGSRRAGRRPK